MMVVTCVSREWDWSSLVGDGEGDEEGWIVGLILGTMEGASGVVVAGWRGSVGGVLIVCMKILHKTGTKIKVHIFFHLR